MMNCDVIKDLLPLYVDGCCSEESAKLVGEHLDMCDECREALEKMKAPIEQMDPIEEKTGPVPVRAAGRINDWKASVLQSALLYISFLIITVGVAAEASTPMGFANGHWAITVVVPTAGFLLSLANWYYVRLYKSRRAFSAASCAMTLGATLCCLIFTLIHYEYFDVILSPALALTERIEVIISILMLHGLGAKLTIIFCVLSKILSRKYAELLGKE